MIETDPSGEDLTRRTMLRRTVAVGATLAWTIPVVQSLPAAALVTTGSPTGEEPEEEEPEEEEPEEEEPEEEEPEEEEPEEEEPEEEEPEEEEPEGVLPDTEERPPGAGLPVTGSNTSSMAGGALGMLALGAAGIVASKKLSPDPEHDLNQDPQPA